MTLALAKIHPQSISDAELRCVKIEAGSRPTELGGSAAASPEGGTSASVQP